MIKIIDKKDFSISQYRQKNLEKNSEISSQVSTIIADVRKHGDKALFDYTLKFDKVKLNGARVSAKEIDSALKKVDKKFISVLEEAAENIKNFHKNQKRSGFSTSSYEGTVMGQKVLAIEKVGLYIPGGTASYPSSVLMNAIPAKIAGVEKLFLTTPCSQNGSVSDSILAAAHIAGVDTIYKFGGAQAIAALAYGTESVEKVDKIVGPGNAYVAEAKRQVFGAVSIDMIAGPSEILIIADKNADAKTLAIDLLSQAEHDKKASSILITNDKDLALKCSKELEAIIPKLKRSDIARCSIDDNGLIIITKDIESAISLSEEIAPEHLELQVENYFDYLSSIKNAGSIFLGYDTPEALGDYFAGANHVLPTSGTARFSSPLSVDDFTKRVQYTYFSKKAFSNVAEKVALFASNEGLEAHGMSALARIGKI